ncbi:MAG: hypothetical protein HY235_21445 [Acidobacteria bacterium]|nr:hypothetical protein [Acidobacteriota bacterium]
MAAELQPATERSYRNYIAQTEKTLAGRAHFLLIDSAAGRRERAGNGEVFVEERRPRQDPPGGLIHHWEGSVFIPAVPLTRVLELVQKYDNHKNVYGPEVMDSQTLEHNGNDFRIRLRLLKKKILTVVLETEHEVRYRPIDATRWESQSHTTRISEVEHPGSPNERLRPPGTGHGFVWRMDTFWRFLEADVGVFVECTSISLSRNIPLGMTRLIRPIIAELPEESLRNVLRQTRDALRSR